MTPEGRGSVPLPVPTFRGVKLLSNAKDFFFAQIFEKEPVLPHEIALTTPRIKY